MALASALTPPQVRSRKMDTETALNLCPFSQRGPLQTPSTLVIPALTTSQASAELCPFPSHQPLCRPAGARCLPFPQPCQPLWNTPASWNCSRAANVRPHTGAGPAGLRSLVSYLGQLDTCSYLLGKSHTMMEKRSWAENPTL